MVTGIENTMRSRASRRLPSAQRELGAIPARQPATALAYLHDHVPSHNAPIHQSDAGGAARPDVSDAGAGRYRTAAPFRRSRSYAAGEHIVKAGDVAPGLIVVLSGHVEIVQDGGLGRREVIVTHGPGQFAGELAQLSARPSLVNAEALEPVEALVVRSERLRDLMVQEAELGERIMRALILRRVGLLRERRRPARSSSDTPAAPTCCGCRASSPATASRTACSIPTAIRAPRP